MRAIFAMSLILTLAGCAGGGSGAGGALAALNPFNWFQGPGGASAPRTLAPRRGYTVAIDTRPMIDQIKSVALDRTTSGAILRATALAPAQGFHSVDLVLVQSAKSNELTFQFRARPPGEVTHIGAERLRELVAAVRLSDAQLHGLRRINVIATRNSKSLRP